MQVDDIDRYGAPHVVVTGSIEKKINKMTLVFFYLKWEQVWQNQIPFHIC